MLVISLFWQVSSRLTERSVGREFWCALSLWVCPSPVLRDWKAFLVQHLWRWAVTAWWLSTEVWVYLLPLKNLSSISVFSLVYFNAFSKGLLFLCFYLSIIFYIQICILDACTVWKMTKTEVLLQLLLNFEWVSASRFITCSSKKLEPT